VFINTVSPETYILDVRRDSDCECCVKNRITIVNMEILPISNHPL
jgi:hypothetical protein